jgi:hypothetical protein
MALSDYLLWRLPAEAQLYIYSHYEVFDARHVPYLFRMLQRKPPPDGWHELLDRFEFDVLALSTQDPSLALFDHVLEQAGRQDTPWLVIYKKDGESGTGPSEVLAVRRRTGTDG